MTDYIDQRFDGGIVTLDGNSYRQCTFDNVVLEYAGGEISFVDNKVGFYVLSFIGPFAEALASLRSLSHAIGQGAILGVAEQVARSIQPRH